MTKRRRPARVIRMHAVGPVQKWWICAGCPDENETVLFREVLPRPSKKKGEK